MRQNAIQNDSADRVPGVVVIVNDDPTQLLTLQNLVRKAGFQAICFSGAEDALLAMDESVPPALIITDVFMPRLDGWRFCRLLRSPDYAGFNQVPILVVSATFAGREPEQIAADLGADAFLPCPVDGDEFVATIRSLVAGEVPTRLSRVLVIEDNPAFSSLLENAFAGNGYRVSVASSCLQARALFMASAYEVAVIDYQLPDGSGESLLESFYEAQPGCVLVMMSGDDVEGMSLRWMTLGASAILHKPFDLAYLIALCAKGRRERTLLRTEELLELRTSELRRSEEQYRTLMAGVPDIVIRFDDAMRCLFVSENAALMNGLPVPLIVGKTYRELNFPAGLCDVCETALRQVFETQSAVATEYSCEGPDGGRTFTWLLEPEFETTVTPAASGDPAGRVKSVLTFARDITLRRRAENEREKLLSKLAQAQKMETVGRLASGVAHDFNNMLGVIIGNTELLLELMDPVDPTTDSLKEVLDAALRSADITRQLLGFARKQAVSPVSLNLNQSVAGTVNMLRRLLGAHVTLTWRPGDGIWGVFVDPCQLDQIVANLCLNARDAIGDRGGRISVHTANITLDQDFCDKHAGSVPGDYVRLSVRDNGCGMPDSMLVTIFEPFFTTKEVGMGTGLGLATVYGIVKQNNGYIYVSSKVGEGSLFDVYLPRQDAVVNVAPAVRAAAPGAGHRTATLLVVDDEPAILNLSCTFLEKKGYTVLTASRPDEAIRLVEGYDGCVDLLLTDVMMPGMNGTQLAQSLQKHSPAIKCLFMSGYSEDVLADQMDEGPSVGFLQKPFSISDLSAKVRALLEVETPVAGTGSVPPSRLTAGDVRPARSSMPLCAVNSDALVVAQALAGDSLDDRVRFSLQWQQTLRMDSVGNLVRGVAHDCGNLFMVIQWYAENAIELIDAGHPAHEWLSRIMSSTQKSTALTREMLVRQMLDFSSTQKVFPVNLDLNSAVSASVKLLKCLVGEDIELVWVPGDGLWTIRMDPMQVEQILAHMCLNARDAIDGKQGCVTIETESVTLDHTPLSDKNTCVSGDYVRLVVADNGRGMSLEVRKHIFEPFFSTKPAGQGSGLGLSSVFGIVKQNRGYITVDSEPGEGAVFQVYFPRVSAAEGCAIADERRAEA